MPVFSTILRFTQFVSNVTNHPIGIPDMQSHHATFYSTFECPVRSEIPGFINKGLIPPLVAFRIHHRIDDIVFNHKFLKGSVRQLL